MTKYLLTGALIILAGLFYYAAYKNYCLCAGGAKRTTTIYCPKCNCLHAAPSYSLFFYRMGGTATGNCLKCERKN